MPSAAVRRDVDTAKQKNQRLAKAELLQDVLVYQDAGSASRRALEYAQALARASDGNVTALMMTVFNLYGTGYPAEASAAAWKAARDQAVRERIFSRRISRKGCPRSLRMRSCARLTYSAVKARIVSPSTDATRMRSSLDGARGEAMIGSASSSTRVSSTQADPSSWCRKSSNSTAYRGGSWSPGRRARSDPGAA